MYLFLKLRKVKKTSPLLWYYGSGGDERKIGSYVNNNITLPNHA